MTTLKPTLDLAARAAIAGRTEALFRASGAFREGHFQLKSGRHGDAYVEKFAVLSDPAATSELCGFWAARMRSRDGTAAPPLVDLVAGPTTGGVILAWETARQLGVRSIFAEEVHGQGIAGEACRAALDWADKSFKPETVWAIIAPSNAPSFKLAERLGFERVGETLYQGELTAVLKRSR